MAGESGIEILWMRTAIHIDCAPGMGSSNADDDHLLLFGQIEKLHTVRCMEHARATGRLAADVRIVLRRGSLAELVYSARPRLKRHVGNLQVGGGDQSGR